MIGYHHHKTYHLPTHLPTHRPTYRYLPTCLPTYRYLPTCLYTYLPTWLYTYLAAYLPTYLYQPTYLPLPTCPPTYMPAYLPFVLFTWRVGGGGGFRGQTAPLDFYFLFSVNLLGGLGLKIQLQIKGLGIAWLRVFKAYENNMYLLCFIYHVHTDFRYYVVTIL
jgi:hypothetical protein